MSLEIYIGNGRTSTQAARVQEHLVRKAPSPNQCISSGMQVRGHGEVLIRQAIVTQHDELGSS